MSTLTVHACPGDAERRRQARFGTFNGFDYLEVSSSQTELRVFFLGRAPDWIEARHLRIEGGARERDIRVRSVRFELDEEGENDDVMVVTVDRPGDFSTYMLRLTAPDGNGAGRDAVPPGFDPRYASLAFTFKAGCPSDLDCRPEGACAPPAPPAVGIDYLAKDYAGFRRLILDRMAVTLPEWRERHAPDLGVTLVELLAHAGDQLSYFQDAVAGEGYLGTARRRISVRRHARLVDYRLHEGCNSRAWMALETDQETTGLDLDSLTFLTRQEAGMVFSPLPAAGRMEVHGAHNLIRFHTWNGSLRRILKGATAATLIDGDGYPDEAGRRLRLKEGDVLILEERMGPRTGNPADADPSRRHAVRLTKAVPADDPVSRTLLLDIEWCAADALPFDLCLFTTTPAPECRPIPDVSVARGNVLLAHHGAQVSEALGQVPLLESESRCADGCGPAGTRRVAGRFRPSLGRTGLTFAEPLPRNPVDRRHRSDEGLKPCGVPARDMLAQDPRAALPSIVITGFPAAPDGAAAFSPPDLLDATRLAHALAKAVDMDEGPAGWLRSRLGEALRRRLERWHAADPDRDLPPALQAELRTFLGSLVRVWEPRLDLLDSGPADRHFVAEIDDAGIAWLRFGDGRCGMPPEALETLHARYLVGNGPEGNVGRETLVRLAMDPGSPPGADLRASNPMPARGGSAPEAVADAKLNAPHVFRSRLERAVTPGDYAEVAMREFPAEIQKAAAVLRWNGNRAEVLLAVDARGTAGAGGALLSRVARRLGHYRRMGHDLRVVPGRSVPLDLALSLCLKPGYLRGHVRLALEEVLGVRPANGGKPGFFHPDRLSFGEAVRGSALVALALGVEGVTDAQVVRLERLFEGPNGELEKGILALGDLEIARLDNHPGFPENGRLELIWEGAP